MAGGGIAGITAALDATKDAALNQNTIRSTKLEEMANKRSDAVLRRHPAAAQAELGIQLVQGPPLSRG